jgi:hypothetical protein
MDSAQRQEEEGIPRLLASLYLLLSLAYLVWMLWLMVPDHRKTALRMRLLRSSSRVTSRLARHAADRSMSRELATGLEQYEVPYWLARRVLDLDAAYDRARGVTS